MSGFIKYLVNAHFNIGPTVQPRIKGKFEPSSAFSQVAGIDEQQTPATIRDIGPVAQNATVMPHERPASAEEAKPFTASDTGREIRIDQYKQDDSNLLKMPEFEALFANNGHTPRAAVLLAHERVVMNTAEQKPAKKIDRNEIATSSHVMSNKPFTKPATSSFDQPPTDTSAVIPKENQVFASIRPVQLNNEPDRRPQNNLAWVRAVKTIVNDKAAGDKSGSESGSVIKINIGRIDVRAITQPQTQQREAPKVKPGVSLSDFLKNKNGN